MTLPLDGVFVLDLSRALAGPYCSEMLGDMGADVIKLEQPGKGDESRGWGPPFQGGESSYFLSINRNKRSLTLDLKASRGKEIFLDLVSRADVLIENFRPGKLAKLGLAFEDLRERNPRLVWCSITGFGSTGPDAKRPGYDIIAQGMGGMMSVTGEPGRIPIRPGVALADVSTGMFAAYGILVALFERERSGLGQHVDTSLFEGQLAQMVYQAGRYFATGEAPVPLGNRHPTIAPYETIRADDGYFNVACGNDGLFRAFCEALGLAGLPEEARFADNASRLKHRQALIDLVEAKTLRMTVDELRKLLDAAGVPNGPVWDFDQAFNSAQATARGMVVEADHPTAGRIRMTGIPIKYSRTPGTVRRPPPTLGEHTDEILADLLDLDDEEIARLHEEKVV